MSVTSICGRLLAITTPLPGFYQRHIWANISFLFTSQQNSSIFNLVEVTCKGLCSIFHRTVLLSCENLPLSATSTLLAKTRGPSYYSMTSIKARVLRCSLAQFPLATNPSRRAVRRIVRLNINPKVNFGR